MLLTRESTRPDTQVVRAPSAAAPPHKLKRLSCKQAKRATHVVRAVCGLWGSDAVPYSF